MLRTLLSCLILGLLLVGAVSKPMAAQQGDSDDCRRDKDRDYQAGCRSKSQGHDQTQGWH